MRAILIYLFLVTLFFQHAFSQQVGEPISEGTPFGEYRTNFAIPDIPAFNILNAYPSTILRPSNTKELSVIASDFSNGGSFAIPQSFAAEIAPWLLISSKKSIAEYQKKSWIRFLYNTSISIASQRNNQSADNAAASDLAAGLRFSIAGKGGDIKMDTSFLKEYVFVPKEKLMVKRDSLMIVFLKDNNYLPFDDTDTAKTDEFNLFLKEKFYQANEDIVNNDIRSAIEKYKEKNWNHFNTDFAVAWRGFSKDSLLENTKSQNIQLWFTQAIRLKNWGQLLIGLNYQLNSLQSDTTFSSITLPSRIYAGTNRIKGFLEFQYTYDGDREESAYLFNFGSELNIIDGVWVELNAGTEKMGDQPLGFVSNFNLRFTLPEKFNLF